MKKRTFKGPLFLWVYGPLAFHLYLLRQYRMRLGKAYSVGLLCWYKRFSPFTYICFANIGCGSEKHIR